MEGDAQVQADTPIKTTDVEWNKAVQKFLLGPSGDGRARVYTAEEMQAVQKMRESFADKTAVPDKGKRHFTDKCILHSKTEAEYFFAHWQSY